MATSSYVFVRPIGKAWRDSEIEIVDMEKAVRIDKKPRIVIDGSPVIRYRVHGNSICAVTEVAALAIDKS